MNHYPVMSLGADERAVGEPVGTVLTDGTLISPEGHFRSSSVNAIAEFVYIVKTPNEALNS